MLRSSSGREAKIIGNANNVSLMYKLKRSSKESEDFSIGFQRDTDTRKGEMNNIKKTQGKYQKRVFQRRLQLC